MHSQLLRLKIQDTNKVFYFALLKQHHVLLPVISTGQAVANEEKWQFI